MSGDCINVNIGYVLCCEMGWNIHVHVHFLQVYGGTSPIHTPL